MNAFEPLHGCLTSIAPGWTLAAVAAGALILGYTGARLWVWTAALFAVLVGLGAPLWLGIALVAPALLFNVRPLRRVLVSAPLLRWMNALKLLPTISETERTAIEAGTVWVDGELFSGKPDLERLASEAYPGLTEEEQAFVDGPVEELCRLGDDWEVRKRKDLSPEVWDFLKRNGFFGLVIPREYGGLGFSASAHSAIVAKIATRGMVLGSTVMVPNALGPAELLIHYGTKAQKDYWLPRQARGEAIPCFALTEPNAGSDAGSIRSSGEVFRSDDGELYLRLDWNKRYITLAAVADVLGLAFKLTDPGNLLGKGTDPGITCALIPTDTPGVRHDRRHVVHFNVTAHPTAEWTAQQIVEAFPDDTAPRFLLRDRDGIYGSVFQQRVRNMGIEEVPIAPRSPWQNPYVERLIGSIRRDCVNHVIVLNERHLRRILCGYFQYYNQSRTHLSLDRNSPLQREVDPPENGKVVAVPQVGGLHHLYRRVA